MFLVWLILQIPQLQDPGKDKQPSGKLESMVSLSWNLNVPWIYKIVRFVSLCMFCIHMYIVHVHIKRNCFKIAFQKNCPSKLT